MIIQWVTYLTDQFRHLYITLVLNENARNQILIFSNLFLIYSISNACESTGRHGCNYSFFSKHIDCFLFKALNTECFLKKILSLF